MEKGTEGRGVGSSNGKKKVFTDEFKRSVVDHLRTTGHKASAVAREFGVNYWSLQDWKRKYEPETKGPADALPQTAAEMLQEIRVLRQQLARVTHQREILKKTLGIVAEPL
jgi:transposase-like protein